MSRTAVVFTTGFRERSEPHTAFLNGGDAVPLRGGSGLQFLMRLEYTIDREASANLWRVRDQGYWYEFDLAHGSELVAFHWHPRAKGTATVPHLHLGPGAGVTHQGLASAHIPTGPVSLQTVIEFAIDELDAEAQRSDWRGVLRRAGLTMQDG